MNPLNNCYESISSGPALVRNTSDFTYTSLVFCTGDCWGYVVLDVHGNVIAGSRRYTMDALRACEEADERLAELAEH